MSDWHTTNRERRVSLRKAEVRPGQGCVSFLNEKSPQSKERNHDET